MEDTLLTSIPPPTPAAVTAKKALEDQILSAKIDSSRQHIEFGEVHAAFLASSEWIGQAEAVDQLAQENARFERIRTILGRLSAAYKVGFDAGRDYQREHGDSEKAGLIQVAH